EDGGLAAGGFHSDPALAVIDDLDPVGPLGAEDVQGAASAVEVIHMGRTVPLFQGLEVGAECALVIGMSSHCESPLVGTDLQKEWEGHRPGRADRAPEECGAGEGCAWRRAPHRPTPATIPGP